MSKISSPISLFELGSTHVNISIYDEFTSSNNLHYEEKLEYTDKQNFFENDQIQNSIVKAEKDLGWIREVSVQDMCKEMTINDLEAAKRNRLLKENGFSIHLNKED